VLRLSNQAANLLRCFLTDTTLHSAHLLKVLGDALQNRCSIREHCLPVSSQHPACKRLGATPTSSLPGRAIQVAQALAAAQAFKPPRIRLGLTVPVALCQLGCSALGLLVALHPLPLLLS
jgi:hypothetical protein